MAMTITEKILARAAGKDSVIPGEVITAKIDVAMAHDVTSDDAIKIVEKDFNGRIAKNLKIVVTPDHYVPNKDIASAILYQNLMGFCDRHNLEHVYPVGENYGVCHVMLPQEGHIRPGEVIVGADSHTCTYGALGAFSTGIGSTELGNVFATGELWFKVPESSKFEIEGKLPKNTMAKDIFLEVVGDIGVDGALYEAMEWTGETIEDLSVEERMTLTNMAIEAGAKNGIIAPDKKAFDYVAERSGKTAKALSALALYSDDDASYLKIKRYDVSDLEPLVAKPFLPSNVSPASELNDIEIDQAYIGGCTGGKLEDFLAAAEVLKGRKKAKNVRLLIVPSTQKVYRKIMNTEMKDIFFDAGAVISAPTCGACLGGYMGILAPREKCISSTNRNFRGRMGHPDSEVYLASPKTVAASAIAGYIRGAEE
ncbi:3-isopropylmalate dehydratase large subunit [archaeon]|nr:MAG: 3-isopropylmalate dehydratase large subunit [archaeon]